MGFNHEEFMDMSEPTIEAFIDAYMEIVKGPKSNTYKVRRKKDKK
jgi:hypothetical protein